MNRDRLKQEPSGDLISREETLTAFADYVGSGMSMDDYDALWDIVAKMPAVNQQEPVLAKIRAEIWDLQYGPEEKSMTDEDRADAYNNAISQAIEIIDKYKAESEIKK